MDRQFRKRPDLMPLRLDDGTLNPRHPHVVDFMVGNATRFEELSETFRAQMHSGRHPLIEALGVVADPAVIDAIHDGTTHADEMV